MPSYSEQGIGHCYLNRYEFLGLLGHSILETFLSRFQYCSLFAGLNLKNISFDTGMDSYNCIRINFLYSCTFL